jgi:hypothetical protein
MSEKLCVPPGNDIPSDFIVDFPPYFFWEPRQKWIVSWTFTSEEEDKPARIGGRWQIFQEAQEGNVPTALE